MTRRSISKRTRETARSFSPRFQAALVSAAAVQTAAMTIGGKPNMMVKPYKRELLQDIVTWDEV